LDGKVIKLDYPCNVGTDTGIRYICTTGISDDDGAIQSFATGWQDD
jgi:hypothetical protein